MNNPAIPGLVPPPPGVTPNFTNPLSNQNKIIDVNIAGLVFVLVFFAMRIYTRTFITRSLGWDDCKFRPLAQCAQPSDQTLDTCIIAFVRFHMLIECFVAWLNISRCLSWFMLLRPSNVCLDSWPSQSIEWANTNGLQCWTMDWASMRGTLPRPDTGDQNTFE